jgi:hypothetical protein
MEPIAYTVSEFCEAYRISKAHLYNLIARGQGPALLKAGRSTRITSASATRWAREREALDGAKSTRGEREARDVGNSNGGDDVRQRG